MKDKNILLKDLTGKDEVKARQAADFLINCKDMDLYKMLAEKSDFLFPFVRNNVCKRIEKAVTKENFSNIIDFFDYYSSYYDDLFASILAKHANENLTDKIFEMLENGTNEQKAYCAKYFSYIPDTVALEVLGKYAFSEDENLSANSAEALGEMQDDVSFDIALSMLEADDDFDKLKAVKFFCAYGKNYPFKEIFNALKTSKMPENIAGQIPYMESLLSLLNSEFKQDTLNCIYYLISGLGEILPVSDVFQFEMYEILDLLININKEKNSNSAKISVILLSALAKFNTFNENDEYLFDEDKNTKQEIYSILKLLQKPSNDFWNMQKQYAVELLNGENADVSAALTIIAEYNINEAVSELKNMVNSENEIIACEVLNTLKALNALEGTDIKAIAQRMQNPNIKALIENML